MRILTVLICCLAFFGSSLFGCGGGGGNGQLRVRGNVRLFVTDDLHEGYDHVWVSIKKVALMRGTQEHVLFEKDAGEVVDVRSLRDSTGGRFLLLAASSIPAGNYDAIHVTVDRNLTIVPTGASTGIAATFAGGTTPNQVIELEFEAPESVDADEDFVLDFDLAHWQLDGTVVTAPGGYIKMGDEDELHDEDRQDACEVEGQIVNLAGVAPNQTFIVDGVMVRTNPDTVIFNEDGAHTPVLANDRYVSVTGKYDVTSDEFVATGIVIYDEEVEMVEGDEVGGSFVSANPSTGDIVISLEAVEGFLPESNQVTIRTNPQTVFVGCNGLSMSAADFIASLRPGMEVEANGVMASGEFTATTVWACHGEEESMEPEESEFSGSVSAINATAGTFTLTVQEFEGCNVALTSQINVATQTSTEFWNGDVRMTASEFFAALTAGRVVGVSGIHDDATGSVTAVCVWFGDLPEDDEDRPWDDDDHSDDGEPGGEDGSH